MLITLRGPNAKFAITKITPHLSILIIFFVRVIEIYPQCERKSLQNMTKGRTEGTIM